MSRGHITVGLIKQHATPLNLCGGEMASATAKVMRRGEHCWPSIRTRMGAP